MPLADVIARPDELRMLEAWMRSYRPEELFDENGGLRHEYAALAPEGERRMGANPHANGGLLLKDLALPDFCDYAVEGPKRGVVVAEGARMMGAFLRDVSSRQGYQRRFPHPFVPQGLCLQC